MNAVQVTPHITNHKQLIMNEFNTEAPVPETDGGTPKLNPSGGVDLARDEAVAAGDTAPADSTPVTGESSTAPEAEPEAPATDLPSAPSTPTPEEQAEIDSMVDYTITEETLEQFNASRAEGMEPFKVGDVVKLAKDHPILTGGAGVA